jgi:hypothetical protein
VIKKVLILSVLFSLAILNSVFALNGSQTQEAKAIESTPEATEQPETQWVWGEVVSVDLPSNRVTVKYLDYDTDQENELVLSVDEKTTYENVKSLSDIKPQSPAGVDYMVDPQGQNIAKNISIENIDSLNSEAKPLEELAPKESKPDSEEQKDSKQSKN